MTAGKLDFSDGGKIIGRLKSPKAIKHYKWFTEQTIPHYNAISHGNTVVPTLDEFMLKVVIPEMLDENNDSKAHGGAFRIMRAMTDITHKDEIERLAVQASDAKHRDVKPDTVPGSTSARLDKMETSIDMILQALTK